MVVAIPYAWSPMVGGGGRMVPCQDAGHEVEDQHVVGSRLPRELWLLRVRSFPGCLCVVLAASELMFHGSVSGCACACSARSLR